VTAAGVPGPELDAVFAAHGVAVAYLFGSRAEGSARPDSDHDVAVLFTDPEPAFDATVRLGAALEAELGTPVDVVDLDRAELELRGRVAEQGRLLYSADEPRRGGVRGRRPDPLDRVPAGSRGDDPVLPAPHRRGGPALMVDPDRVRRLLAMLEWKRTLGRMAVARSEKSPFVRITRGKKMRVSHD
jgi:uncharacterized protein